MLSVQCCVNQEGRSFNMVASCRYGGWIALLVIGAVSSAPLDDQRMYFPGENPVGDLESRSYGLQPNLQSQQIQPSYQREEPMGNQEVMWSQDGIHQASVGNEEQQYVPLHPALPAYEGQSGYGGSYSRQEPVLSQYQPAGWASIPQNIGREDMHQAHLFDAPIGGSTSQHSSESHGAASYPLGNPLQQSSVSYLPESAMQQGAVFTGLSNNGVIHGGKKIKHTWTSHYSKTGTGQHQHDLQQMDPHLETDHVSMTGVDQAHMLGNDQMASQDLASILDRPSLESHNLHPNIKKAFENVVKDFGPSHHTVHKISHIKKTTVQNVGKEPVHIHSTSSNDDISLSHLIEELQMLEQSPRHVNITWCEEKIKEFLRALQRKQASGVYINQQVQEQTLHQVLTHESVQNTETKGEVGVNEPLFIKETVRPLGGGSQEVSDISAQEQRHPEQKMESELPPVSVDQTLDEFRDHGQAEIITVIPHETPRQPHVMSHQQEVSKEPPPFTSENNDMKELELELPEYVPFEHAHSGDVNAFEYNVHKETRPLPHSTQEESEQAHLDVPTGHETDSPLKASHSFDVQDQAEVQQQGVLDSSIEEKKDEAYSIPSANVSQQQNSEIGHEYLQSLEETHHLIHGRPQAPPEEVKGDSETNHEEKLIHTLHEGQSLNHHESSHEMEVDRGSLTNGSQETHLIQINGSNAVSIPQLHKQQINYDTLIEELIQLESIPGHQAIDKCEEKIQEFLEILKYQQEQGFGRNQLELERLHQTLIEQAQERSRQIDEARPEESTLSPSSFWRKVQKKIKKTYDNAKDRAKEVIG